MSATWDLWSLELMVVQGLGVWGVGFGVWSFGVLGFRVWGLGFGGLAFRV